MATESSGIALTLDCDCCGKCIIAFNLQAGNAELLPHVCVWGQTLCMRCADLLGIDVRNRFFSRDETSHYAKS